MRLDVSTCLAENTLPATRALAEYLSKTLEISIKFDETLSFENRLAKINSGDICLSWICGLLYTRLQENNNHLSAMLAPLFSYTSDELPVYYSYIITRKDNFYQNLGELKGMRLALNERASFSGYEILRHYYGKTQQMPEFSQVLVTSSHLASVQSILANSADVAAIDHSLYSYWAKHNPDLAQNLKILEPLGPFPAPPFVVHESLDSELKRELELALLALPEAFLDSLDLKGFRQVDDRYYDAIRQAVELGKKVSL